MKQIGQGADKIRSVEVIPELFQHHVVHGSWVRTHEDTAKGVQPPGQFTMALAAEEPLEALGVGLMSRMDVQVLQQAENLCGQVGYSSIKGIQWRRQSGGRYLVVPVQGRGFGKAI